MTKAEQARIVAWRQRIIRHTEEEPRYVAQTCRLCLPFIHPTQPDDSIRDEAHPNAGMTGSRQCALDGRGARPERPYQATHEF